MPPVCLLPVESIRHSLLPASRGQQGKSLAEEASQSQGSPCKPEVLIRNWESGFSVNLLLFLQLHNNIVLVAKKPFFN